MPITYEIDQWLQGDGAYENHCFISWPHTINSDITECAQTLRSSILENLATSVHEPKVFLDETGIAGGAAWELTLRRALCRSVCMVAICAPIYYRPEHNWCGLEWAAMDLLSSTRLQGAEFGAIIPVMIRKSDPLPKAVSRVQYIDFSRVTIQGRRFFKFPESRLKIQEIVSRIEQIAVRLWQSGSRANCDLFQFPTKSAFSDYASPIEHFPIVS